jgi:hypothetical protein
VRIPQASKALFSSAYLPRFAPSTVDDKVSSARPRFGETSVEIACQYRDTAGALPIGLFPIGAFPMGDLPIGILPSGAS